MDVRTKIAEFLGDLEKSAAKVGYRIIIERDKDEEGDDDTVYLLQKLEDGDWDTICDFDALEAARHDLIEEFGMEESLSHRVVIEAVMRDRVLKLSEAEDAAAEASLTDLMKSGYGVSTVSEEEAKRREAEREEVRKRAAAMKEEAEAKAKKLIEEDAARLRAAALLIAEIGERITANGYMSHLTKPMQAFIKNTIEVEREFSAAIGKAVPSAAPDEEEVPELLTEFLKRSDAEKAERIAKEEAEAEAKRKAAAVAAASSPAIRPWGEEDTDGAADAGPSEEDIRAEEEKKKIDALFGEGIF